MVAHNSLRRTTLFSKIRPSWSHVLVGCYEHNEVVVEDAHNANPQKGGIGGGTRKNIEIWGSGYLKNETYHETMKDYVTYRNLMLRS